MSLNRLFYNIKPFIPRPWQIAIRSQIALRRRAKYSHIWPIDPGAGKAPEGWTGWPHGKKFALILTHDVDTEAGHEKCRKLAEIEQKMGFRSSFNFVPERYSVSPQLRNYLSEKGFEVAVHGLCHDGKLFSSRKIFSQRAIRINHYLNEWKSVGFHSPSMHRNLDWIHDLIVEYDQSTFDTDPFEPQPDGVRTIFPFWIQDNSGEKGYVELPYTLPQDHTLFVIMKERGINIWKEKLDWIVEKGGMALLNSHPDYMDFNCKEYSIEEYPAAYYEEFLAYVKSKYEGQYWHVVPREMARFWSRTMV